MQNGTAFGRYRLLELTSRGAAGDTWQAFDTVTQREVALRIPSTQDTGGAAAKRDTSDPAYGPQSGVVVEYVVDYPSARPDDLGEDQSTPNPPFPKRSRKGRWVAVSSAAIVVAVATVATTIIVPRYLERSASPPASSTAAPPARLANTGPLTGTFRVSMGPRLAGSGTPSAADGSEAYSETWQLRSLCTPAGCVATASTGGWYPVADLVFDNVGQRWLAVSTSRKQCGDRDDESFNAILLEPQPDGTLAGESTQATTGGCFSRRTVTFTRTGDTDVAQLPDPAGLASRKVSPAEAMRGRYDVEITYANRYKPRVQHYGVRTDCLRAGDRCMSFFLAPDGSEESYVFANGAWTLNEEYEMTCSTGGSYRGAFSATVALPQPPQDPIPSLTGHGYDDVTQAVGSTCRSQSYDETFTRTGD
jgi:hypothetical protein